ncbi:arginase family protein [Emericellopsis atlantica]|uniref:Arginase family protein n=1 Tax=Emericellopsis atlantica TaxID=2614577 RepID=A0A9P7ZQT9_9HYPO|nr:arginase family protein [Emericellopsis atlantica]KAG9256146.1 arginase family protein [Emericellopsis atlantica]
MYSEGLSKMRSTAVVASGTVHATTARSGLVFGVSSPGEAAVVNSRGQDEYRRERLGFRQCPADEGPIEISEITYSGLNTFAGVAHAQCFQKDNDSHSTKRYDIAVLGAPLDTTVTGRPGARYGPSAIRAGSLRKAWGFDTYTGRDPLKGWARVVDCGDAPMTWLDNRAAIKTLDQAHRLTAARPPADDSKSHVPRIVTLGGDHTTTLSALRGTYDNWGHVSVVHFDSHIGELDPDAACCSNTAFSAYAKNFLKIRGIPKFLLTRRVGGGVSDYAYAPMCREEFQADAFHRGLNHGTFLHVAHEEGLIRNSSIHVGIRASLNRREGDMKNDRRCGFATITARDLDTCGVQGVVDQIRNRVKDTQVYITVDIDVLDPAFAPATGTPEVGGWSTRELLAILEGLGGLKIVGADVVEVSPPFDNHGETTALAAAEIVHSLIDLMVLTPASLAEYLSTARRPS